nr:MAG TPA: hypothetical protein [Caudoviricetes sp.]
MKFEKIILLEPRIPPIQHARQFLKKAKIGILLRCVKTMISSDKNHV